MSALARARLRFVKVQGPFQLSPRPDDSLPSPPPSHFQHISHVHRTHTVPRLDSAKSLALVAPAAPATASI
jgi:hypothetical protein